MRYYTVEPLVFSAWCERTLPYPRGSQIAQQAQYKGMVAALGALKPGELSAWITQRDQVADVLGAAFMPDATLQRSHFYEQARARLAIVWRPRLP
jgi:hypothetical protein